MRKRSTSAFAHLYHTNRWRKTSETHRKREPLCVMCHEDGKIVAGNTCDHINGHPVDETEEQFWQGPFQTLCAEHHSGAKQQVEKSGTYRGVTTSGIPLDYSHPWNC